MKRETCSINFPRLAQLGGKFGLPFVWWVVFSLSTYGHKSYLRGSSSDIFFVRTCQIASDPQTFHMRIIFGESTKMRNEANLNC